MLNSRKSQILGEFTVVVFSLIALIMILVIFYILMSMNTHSISFEIDSVADNVDLEIMLNNLLLTPVVINSHQMPLHQALPFSLKSDISSASVKDQLESQVSDFLTIAENYYPNYIIGKKEKSMVECRVIYKITFKQDYSVIFSSESSHFSYVYNEVTGTRPFCDPVSNSLNPENNPNLNILKRSYSYPDGSKINIELESVLLQVT
jgi:hypothetical protein